MSEPMSDAVKKSLQELHQKREAVQRQKEREAAERQQRKGTAGTVGQFANAVLENTPQKPPVKSSQAVVPQYPTGKEREAKITALWPHLARELGYFHFDLFTSDHLTAPQKRVFEAVLNLVKRWEKEERTGRDGSFFGLCSKAVGVGKTSLCQAVAVNFWEMGAEREGPLPDVVDGRLLHLSLDKKSRLLTGQEVVDLVSKKGISEGLGEIINPKYRVLILDDIGRGEVAKYEKRDDHEQSEAIKNIYFQIINKVWEIRNTNRRIALMMTSNKTIAELKAFLGDASWSRLCGMAPEWLKEPFIEINGLVDYRVLSRKAKQEKKGNE